MIAIEKERYDELLEIETTLKALEYAGVENWEGYEEAMEIFEDMMEQLLNE